MLVDACLSLVFELFHPNIRVLMGCFGERLGCFRVPQGCLGEALGSSRAALWTVLGCFRAASGKLWGAFASSEGASPAEMLKMLDLLHFLSENTFCEVPEARK